MSIDHAEVQTAASALWSAARRFERNAHLGQSLRSHEVYAWCIEGLSRCMPDGRFTEACSADLDGFAKARGRILWASKHGLLDRAATVELMRQMAATVDEATARAKASR